MANKMKRAIRLNSFAFRQFDDPSFTGTKIPFDKQAFEDKINQLFGSGQVRLVDGCVTPPLQASCLPSSSHLVLIANTLATFSALGTFVQLKDIHG